MPDLAAVARIRQDEVADTRERLRVEVGGATALLVPLVEERQLAKENERLDRVESRGPADRVVLVLRRCPCSRSERTLVGEFGVVGDERACVSHRAEILPRVEAERAGGPSCAGAHAVARRSVRLTGVLDDDKTVGTSDCRQRRSCRRAGRRGALARMNCGARADGSRQRRLDRCSSRRSEMSTGIGNASCLTDRLERRNERQRRYEHLVARLHAERDESEPERVEAARDADAVPVVRSTTRTPTRTPVPGARW